VIVWPVIERELREEARRSSNYWMRVLGAAALLFAILFISLTPFGLVPGRGGVLFGNLNALLFLSIWIIVPILTADCISREKREGTLGLLFLTPLKSSSIVLAKGTVHALRASSLLLAAIPILAIPMLLGGVRGTDLMRAALLDSSALVLALSAGLRASSLCRERTRAIVLAVSLGAALALVLLEAHAVVLSQGPRRLWDCWAMTTGAGGAWSSPGMILSPGQIFGGAFIPGPRGQPLSPFFPGPRPWAGAALLTAASGLNTALGVFVASVTVLFVVLFLAARQLRKNWQDEPPSPWRQWWLNTFCTPRLWRGMFHKKMARTLDRNPIGWLQQYSWSARLAKWGWCLGLVLYECFLILYDYWDNYMSWQFWPALFLIASMAFSAANSFARERQTGALELLLVTPLPVRKIIGGRILGIWEQFLPSLLVWLAVWSTLSDRRFESIRTPYLILFAGSFFTIAVIGLYYSLRRMHFMAAWLMTGVTGILFPALLTMTLLVMSQSLLVYSPMPFRNFVEAALVLFVGFQLGLAYLAWRLMNRNLSQRLFVLV
jgi:ABC-type transport system involved in cytochrome c biogenesis permease component